MNNHQKNTYLMAKIFYVFLSLNKYLSPFSNQIRFLTIYFFRDKLKAFKNIEISAGVNTTTASTVGGLGKRRESEPQLPRTAELKTTRSTSSSSLQNNKFFQQVMVQL